ncbi:hypothetical protein D3C71_1734590 [compost metagenome]
MGVGDDDHAARRLALGHLCGVAQRLDGAGRARQGQAFSLCIHVRIPGKRRAPGPALRLKDIAC